MMMGSYNIPDELVVRISRLGEEPRVFILRVVRQAVDVAEKDIKSKEVN
jgi:hypothetical protein